MLAARGADVPPRSRRPSRCSCILATWASVQHLYRQIPQFDVLVHFLTPGSLAAVAYFVLVRARLLPGVRSSTTQLRSWAPVVLVVVVGVTAAVSWEFNVWGIEQVAPSRMRVGYTDTVVDLFAGTLGTPQAASFSGGDTGTALGAWVRNTRDGVLR